MHSHVKNDRQMLLRRFCFACFKWISYLHWVECFRYKMLVNFFTKVFLLLIDKSQFFIRKIVCYKCELLGTVLSVGHQQAFDDRNFFFRRDEFDSGKRSGGFVLCHHLTVTEDGRREHKKKGSQRGWRPSDHQEREEKSRERERERVREREREREEHRKTRW